MRMKSSSLSIVFLLIAATQSAGPGDATATGTAGDPGLLKPPAEAQTVAAPSCNPQLLAMFLKTQTSAAESISKFCPSVKNSCCSGAQIQELLEEFQGRRAAVLALFKAAEVLVDRIRRTPSTPYKKLVEEWKAVPAKQDTGVGDAVLELSVEELEEMSREAVGITANYSEFLEAQFLSISGFACSICDADHSDDFVVDPAARRVVQVSLKIAQCQNLFEQHFALYETYEIVRRWLRIANIIDHLKKRPVRFSYDNYVARGQRYFNLLKTCAYGAGGEQVQLSTTCGVMCEEAFTFNSVVVPFQVASAIQYIGENFGEYFYSEPLKSGSVGSADLNYHVVVFSNLQNPDDTKPDTIVTNPQKGVCFAEQQLDHGFSKQALWASAVRFAAVVVATLALAVI